MIAELIGILVLIFGGIFAVKKGADFSKKNRKVKDLEQHKKTQERIDDALPHDRHNTSWTDRLRNHRKTK